MENVTENFNLVYSHIKNENNFVEDLVIQTSFGKITCASGSDYYDIRLHIDGFLFESDSNRRIEEVRKWIDEFNIGYITFEIDPKYNYSTDFIKNVEYIFYHLLSNTCVRELAINNLGILTKNLKVRLDKTVRLTDIHQEGEYSDIKIDGVTILGYTVNTSVNSWYKVKKILEHPLVSSANIECIMKRKQNISDINSRVGDLTLRVNRDIGKVISALSINNAFFADVKEIEI